jgi:glycerol transport system substrate-binding protein
VDQVLEELSKDKGMTRCAPKLNAPKSADQWLNDTRAPRRKLANERPQGATIAYEQLLEAWREGRVR